MNSASIKTVVKYAVCCSTILFFVVLLTMVFSFLGTILCALLAGMMMGATKSPKWLLIPTSLLFPVVIFAVFRAWKTELPEGQMLTVSLVCFSAFWIIYALAAVLTAFEHKGSAETPAVGGGLPAVSAEGPSAASAICTSPGQPSSASVTGPVTEPLGALTLDELQGKWLAEAAVDEGKAQRREIEIKKGELVLRVTDAEGRLGFIARGEVRLEWAHSPQRLVIAPAAAGAGTGPG